MDGAGLGAGVPAPSSLRPGGAVKHVVPTALCLFRLCTPGTPPERALPVRAWVCARLSPPCSPGGLRAPVAAYRVLGGCSRCLAAPPPAGAGRAPPPGGCRAKQRRAPAATPSGSGRAAGGEGWPRHENLWYEEAGDKPGREARERFLPGAGLAAACAAEPGPAGTPRPGRAAWKRPREGFWPLPGQGRGVRRPCCCLPPADASLPPWRRDILVSPPGCR